MTIRGRRWLVVSPHCDDAVLSVGAALSANIRAGGSATVVTVLAGAPESDAPPGRWDAQSGFASEGAATKARHAEDRRACQILGVRVVHLDGTDEQYEGGASDAELWSAVRTLASDHDVVLLPGAPLRHADHRRLAGAATSELAPDTVVVLYGEEPYLLLARQTPGEASPTDGVPVRWRREPHSAHDSLRKVRAVRCYRSQLPMFAEQLHPRRFLPAQLRLLRALYVRARRGEWFGDSASEGDRHARVHTEPEV